MAYFENGNQISYICISYIWTCIKNELKEKPGENVLKICYIYEMKNPDTD